MYHPTTRLLTILELLQTHPQLSGEELAIRLEVETRTVRRYILMLQEMGMPIEGTRGPGGGYRLRPGFKLPPLLFTEEEATAIVLGLLGTQWLEVGLPSMSIEGALAKVSRVLPLRARERLQAVSSHLMLAPPHQQASRPDASLLINLSEAIQLHRRIAFDYRSHHNQVTQRTVEPYGISGWRGYWYLLGYCCLRQDYRLFRLDRMQQIQFLNETFVRAEDFDCQDYIIKHLISVPARWHIEVEFQADLYTLQQKIPSSYGTLTATPTGVLFQCHHVHLPTIGHYLMGLNLPFVIHQPVELREALLQMAEKMVQIATTQPEDLKQETI